MAFEQLKAEIAMLVQQMEDEPEDVHELHARIRQKLAELKATGQPLPDDLAALERRLDSEERAPMRARASSAADQQPASTPSRRQTAGRPRRAAAKKKASPAKKAKRPAARKSAAAASRSAAKKGRRGAAKAKRSTARKAKRSSRRGRR
jgi:hypothetical protein